MSWFSVKAQGQLYLYIYLHRFMKGDVLRQLVSPFFERTVLFILYALNFSLNDVLCIVIASGVGT
jgi:hypothetical protein